MINYFVQFINNFTKDTAINLIQGVLIIAVLDIFSPLFSYIIIKIFNWKKKSEEIKENAFFTPIKSFFRVLGVYLAIIFLQPTFNISQDAMNIVTQIFRIIVIITTATGFVNSITKKSKLIKRIKEKSSKEIDDSATRMLIRIIKFIIYLIAGFMIITDLGYNLNGLITGLGLGSIVVTLAAQDTIKNLLGGLVIFIDKPFKVGDYIRFSTYEGTVEDITFRSTRVRTIENTIAQISNSEIANSTVINYSKIEKRRYELKLGIVLETELNKLLELKTQILECLNNDENVIKDSANVFFSEIGTNEYKISIFCYVNTAEYIEFLNIKERLNYNIMDIVNKNHIELAYETQTVHISRV